MREQVLLVGAQSEPAGHCRHRHDDRDDDQHPVRQAEEELQRQGETADLGRSPTIAELAETMGIEEDEVFLEDAAGRQQAADGGE